MSASSLPACLLLLLMWPGNAGKRTGRADHCRTVLMLYEVSGTSSGKPSGEAASGISPPDCLRLHRRHDRQLHPGAVPPFLLRRQSNLVAGIVTIKIFSVRNFTARPVIK